MNHPYAKKIPRNHPEVQDRQMMVDGFQDFAFKAFHPKYEKSAAPLSKRKNGIGPVKNGEGVFFGNAYIGSSSPHIVMANRYALTALMLGAGIVYANTIAKKVRSGVKNTASTARNISSLTALRYLATGAITYALIQDFTRL